MTGRDDTFHITKTSVQVVEAIRVLQADHLHREDEVEGAAQHAASHFGFCLGVKNAIERAYETLAENPGKRVFMLSELIHNPFVNEDLLRRGLRYLQTDKGCAYTVDGTPHSPQLWDTLTPDDIVITCRKVTPS